MNDFEQVIRLHTNVSAHKHIFDMIQAGSTLKEIENHCSTMIRAAGKQAKILKIN